MEDAVNFLQGVSTTKAASQRGLGQQVSALIEFLRALELHARGELESSRAAGAKETAGSAEGRIEVLLHGLGGMAVLRGHIGADGDVAAGVVGVGVPRMLVSFRRLKPSPIRLSLANSPNWMSFLRRRSSELKGLEKLSAAGHMLETRRQRGRETPQGKRAAHSSDRSRHSADRCC